MEKVDVQYHSNKHKLNKNTAVFLKLLSVFSVCSHLLWFVFRVVDVLTWLI